MSRMSRLNSLCRFPTTRLSLERLEARNLFAGNIFAGVVNSVLTIKGDAFNNNVMIQENQNQGVVVVQGVNTTLNGGHKILTIPIADIDELHIDLANGNDKVGLLHLSIPVINIYTGAGDDVIEIDNFTSDVGGSIQIYSDYSPQANTVVNGDDTITISNTRVTGTDAYLSFGIYMDEYLDKNGHDILTMNNTNVVMASTDDYPFYSLYGFYLETNGGYGVSGPGDDITINNLDVVFKGPGDMVAGAYVNGSTGNDNIRLSNIDMSLYTEVFTFMDLFVDTLPYAAGTDAGGDRIEVANVDISLVSPSGLPFLFGDQLSSFFAADTVIMTNVELQGGSNGYGNSFGVLGNQIDLQNVSITSSQSWVSFFVGSLSLFGLPEEDDSITLTNVTIAMHPSWQDPFSEYILTGDGNDVVTIRNSSFTNLVVDLGDGDDSLTLIDSSFLSAKLFGGNGNDRLKIRKNSGQIDFFDFENV